MSAPHLNPHTLERAQRHLLAKALGELSHERLLTPEPHGDRWRVGTPAGSAYDFAAERLPLEHWQVDPATIRVTRDGVAQPPDVQAFVAELAGDLGVPPDLLPTYLEELASTLAAAMWKLEHPGPTAAELAVADHQTVESAMTEGHPAFVANNGRIGLDLDDYTAYAPETAPTVRLFWLAARREHTLLALGDGLTAEQLYAGEVDDGVRDGFEKRLRDEGLDPDGYWLFPVHPWQWRHRVAITFAPDVARRDLVPLGEGPDGYRPQQSIRTFSNTSRPERHYVKTALAVQNMGFLRGLSPKAMATTPLVNDWVHALVSADPTLRDCGFTVLRERASIGYTGDAYHALDRPSPYRKLLAALWRESPPTVLRDGERVMTMAALLHRDHEGTSVVSELVRASGVDAATWVRDYLDAYVRPVVHCLLAHDLAFMPHGENLLLVLREGRVVRTLMKDVAEEVAVMAADRALPPDVAARIGHDLEPHVRALAFHTDVCDGFLRFLAAVLHQDGLLAADEFWALVGRCVERHEAEHPELAAAAAAYDLFRGEFRHSCLNRLQLRDTREMVDITDQASSLLYAGTLPNPIARGRRRFRLR
jgi:siderophore synthetase component